jgi:four helix bundle protein
MAAKIVVISLRSFLATLLKSTLDVSPRTSIICERSFQFACRILKVCEKLSERGPAGRHVATQLLKCGTSIGANAEEAQEGQTKPDFIAKMSVSRKEAREAAYWLKLSIGGGLLTTKEIEWEQDEARQLLAMIRAAIQTAQSSPHRGSPPDTA